MVFVYTGVFSEYNIIIHYNSVKKNIGIGYLLMAIRRCSSLPRCCRCSMSDVYIGRTLVQICDNIRTFCYRPSLVACSSDYNWWAVQYGRFLPRDAMLSAVYAIVVCLSVCLCVCLTFRYCIKTAKRRITQIMPHDSVFK